MAQCSCVLRLLSFAVLLSCLGTSSAASADATTIIEVDGVNRTVDSEVCEVAAWRVSSWLPFCPDVVNATVPWINNPGFDVV